MGAKKLTEVKEISAILESAYALVVQDGEVARVPVSELLKEVYDIRVGNDGSLYQTAGAAVRQISIDLESLSDDLADAMGKRVPDGLVIDDDQLYLAVGGEPIGDPVDIASGIGGGGGTAGDTIKLTNTTIVGSATGTAMTIVKGNAVTLTYNFYIYDVTGELVQGNATARYYINNALVSYGTIAQGKNSITFSSETGGQLATGTNTIVIRVEDADGNHRSLSYTVSVIDLTLRSTFDNSSPFLESELTSGALQFTYIPFGGTTVEKTVHFLIDDREVGTVTTKNSGKTMTYTFPAMSHGAHVLTCYMTASVNGAEITSNVLRYDFAYIKANGTSLVISSDYNEESVIQGNTISIPYLVYNPAGLTSHVRFTIQYKTVNADTGSEYWATYNSSSISSAGYTVDRTVQTMNIKDYPVGDIRIQIYASGTGTSTGTGSPQRTFQLTVQESEIDLTPMTDSMVLNMDSSGRSNEEDVLTRTVWRCKVDNSVLAQFEDFNWKTNGWVEDGKGGTPLKVSGDAKLTIPYYPFSRNAIGTSGSGMTIDIDFMVDDVSDPNAVLFSCMTQGGPGFQITADTITFASDLQSIKTHFESGRRVRVSLVVDDPMGADKLIRMYTNGVGGSGDGFKSYTSDSMQQGTPVKITAQGVGASLYLYAIRCYTVAHSARDVVSNEIAHYDTVAEKAQAFYANEIYSDGSDEVNMYALQEAVPDLTIVYLYGAALPTAKINNDGSVSKANVTLSGQIIDADNELCCTFEDQKFEIQGTSSAAYKRKNLRGTLKKVTLPNGSTASGYAIRPGYKRAQKITWKKDVASSEQANNTIMASRYNDICPYDNAAQKVDPTVRQGIAGKPCVMFFVCTDPTSPDYNNGQATFIGKYNMNIDKGSHNVFGFEDLTDEDGNPLFPLAQSWEYSNNTSDRCLFRSNDFTTRDALGNYTWTNDLEARFAPDENDPSTLALLYNWITSTNPDNATNRILPNVYFVTKMMANAVVYETYVDEEDDNTVKNRTVNIGGFERKIVESTRFVSEEVTVGGKTYKVMPIDENGAEQYYHQYDTATYRQDKFYQEFEDHFDKNAVLFYYLYTEYYLMIDNRAKNQFITTFDGVHWSFLPYDFDTMIGINNEGELAFGYGAELTDQIGTSFVCNDQGKSVLWNNVRETMSAELAAMYSTLENAGYFDPETVNNLFIAHQSAWPMNIWNEDEDWAYGVPHREGDNTYLPMWQGDKALQRVWWLYHRHVFMCSKYLSASALNDRVQLRTYTPGAGTPSLQHVPADGNFTITPWQDVYINVKWGSYTLKKRSASGRDTIMEKPAGVGSLNDTETYIYSASALKDIGNLAPLYVGQCDISMANHLERLILGSELPGYENTNCKTVTVGKNNCMQLVDVRGLTALEGTLDLSGCENIREVYADRTALTAVSLPDGGYLSTLHLPAVKKLTLCNQEYLEDFQCEDLSGITSLRVENCPGIDLKEILAGCENLQFARLLDVEWTEENSLSLEKLMRCQGIDENDSTTSSAAVVTGSCYIETVDGDVLTAIRRAFPYLNVTYGNAAVTLYFKNGVNDDGEGGEELHRILLTYGSTGYYPFDAMHDEIAKPTLKPTAQYEYEFTGWAGSITNVVASRDITAQYSKTVRKYGVTWKVNGAVVKTQSNIEFGTSVEWDGATPTYSGPETGMIFAGWNFTNTADDGSTTTIPDALRYEIKGNTVAEASFIKAVVPASPTAFSSCTWGQIIALCQAAYDGTLKAKTGYNTLEDYGWAIGDETTITLKSGETNVLKIWGFNINEDETGKVLPVTIGLKYSLKDTRQMNSAARQLYGYKISGGGASPVVATTMNTTYYTTAPGEVTIEFTDRTYLNYIQVIDGANTFNYYFTNARLATDVSQRMDINYFSQEDCSEYTKREGVVLHKGLKDFSYTNAAGATGHIKVDGRTGDIKVFDRSLTSTDNNVRAIEFMPGSKLVIPMTGTGRVVVNGRAIWNGRGYYGSDLRQWLLNSFVDELPAIIQSRLVPVMRKTQIGGLDWEDYDTYYDKLLIPTFRELGYGSATQQPFCNENNKPFPTFSSNDMRLIACYRGGDQDAAASVWLSSTGSGNVNYFYVIYAAGGGTTGNYGAYYSSAVLYGFCIR